MEALENERRIARARELEELRRELEFTELSRLIQAYAAENPASSVARNADELLARALSWGPNDPLPPPRHWADAEDLADAGMEPHTVASASSEESADADDEESAHAGAESAMVGR